MKNNIKNIFRNGAWVFLLALSIESYTFKRPYLVVLGTYFLITSFIFFPWLDKLLELINVKLSGKNKLFLIFINLFLAAYLITPEETNYLRCILPISLMIITWIGVIIYRKLKESSKK